MNRRVLASAAGLAAAATLLAGIQRIDDSELGVRREAVVGPGWAWTLPWARARVVAAEGIARPAPLDLRTPEGSNLSFQAEIAYGLGPEIAPRLREDIADVGVDEALGRLVRSVLQEASRGKDVSEIVLDTSGLDAAVHAALRAAGVRVASASVRSTIGDEAARRRETEIASAMSRPMDARLLVVGWDGADWRTLDPLLAQGRMPNLARMLREGGRANLRSFDPMYSPLLWTSVATGKAPTSHGVADFLVTDPATGTRRPITSDFRKVKALWNILGDLGVRSGWIGWWATYPAEPIEGEMVTELVPSALSRRGIDSTVGDPALAHPAGFLAERRGLLRVPSEIRIEEIRRFFPVGESEFEQARSRATAEPKPEESKDAPPDPVAFMIRIVAATRTFHALALDMVRRDLPVTSVYYEGIDVVGHRFQHYIPPRMSMASPEEFERFRETVWRFHEWQDELLGEILDAAGPRTNVVLLSDHGFRTGSDRPVDIAPYTTDQPVEWHRPWGILALAGPAFRSGVELPPASIYDVTPILLQLAGLPLAADHEGTLPEAAFRPEWLAARPPQRIRSYEHVGTRYARTATPALDPEALDEMMANLKALGYVGAEPEPRGNAAAANPETGDPPPAEAAANAETGFHYHRNLAVQFLKRGQLDDARRELLAANERQPLPRTYAMLSEIEARRGRFREAAEAIEEGYRKVPDGMDDDLLLVLQDMRIRAGELDAARGVGARFRERAGPAVARALEGRIAEERGELAAARAAYHASLDSDPLLFPVVARTLPLDRAAGEPFRLEPLLARVVADHPKADAYWDVLGEMAAARGDTALATERYGRAVDLQPDNPLYLGRLAAAQAAAGRPEEARAALAWALRSSSAITPPEAWIAIGGAWDRLGETDRALAAFAKAREAGALGPAPEIGSVLALARAGRTAEARRRLDEARSKFPDSRALADLAARLR